MDFMERNVAAVVDIVWMTRHVTMSLEPVIKVVSLGTRHQTVLKVYFVTLKKYLLDFTFVYESYHLT